MDVNVGEQINLVINNLADKLGVAVDKVYPILKTQAMIDGIFSISFLFIFALVFLVALKLFGKHIELAGDEWDKHVAVVVISFVIGVISIIGFVVCLINLKTSITAIINPDWYIFNNLLKSIIQ